MKTGLNIIAVMLVVFGFIWILQGLSILPGSFMSGQIKWSVIGTITVVMGLAILWYGRRRK